MSQWTPELKQKVIDTYQGKGPTAENSTELVKEIADELELTANGVRMVLIQAGVYVKKEAASSSSSDKPAGKTASGTGSKRVSKEDSIKALKEKIEAAGKEVDDEILDKLTGKAAVYLATLL